MRQARKEWDYLKPGVQVLVQLKAGLGNRWPRWGVVEACEDEAFCEIARETAWHQAVWRSVHLATIRVVIVYVLGGRLVEGVICGVGPSEERAAAIEILILPRDIFSYFSLCIVQFGKCSINGGNALQIHSTLFAEVV